MQRRISAMVVLSLFVLAIASSCVVKHHVPPGQIRKQTTPGHMKKR